MVLMQVLAVGAIAGLGAGTDAGLGVGAGAGLGVDTGAGLGAGTGASLGAGAGAGAGTGLGDTGSGGNVTQHVWNLTGFLDRMLNLGLMHHSNAHHITIKYWLISRPW